MLHPRLRPFLPLLALLLLLGPVTAAQATSFVPMRDSALADQAELILVARVGGRLPAPTGTLRPVTDYLVVVERGVNGELLESVIVVRLPGGTGADGNALKIWGAPELADGSRVLLFLARHGDAYRPLHLMLGVFHEIAADWRSVAYRDLSEVREKPGADPEAAAELRRVRDFHRFANWLEARARGTILPANYFIRIDPAQIQILHDRYTLMTQGDMNLRWFDFDSGGSVTFYAHKDGQPGLAGGGFQEFHRALDVWTGAAGTPIRYVYGGTTTSSGGLATYDWTNAILFADPNDEIEGTFDCAAGGTLAVGGPWYNTNVTGTFDGRPFVRIQGGDIVTNDGIDCYFQRIAHPAAAAEELFAHELGHTLGMGHSSEDPSEPNSLLRDALMYYRIHSDGRGGRLNADDIAGIRALYAAGGGGATPPPPPADSPTTLYLLDNRFAVTLTWRNQFNNTTGAGKAITFSNFVGFFYFENDPRALEILVKIVDYDGRILVFFSELGIIQFELNVTDRITGESKTYRNTAGDCGAVDPDFHLSDGKTALMTGGRKATIRDLGITRAPKGQCVPDDRTLCLLGDRFSVELPFWRNQFDESSGFGKPLPMGGLAGGFHFYNDPRDLEILFKIYEFPDRILVFYGTLSIFGYTIQMTDETTGRTTEFSNPEGTFCGGFINDLLAGPPF